MLLFLVDVISIFVPYKVGVIKISFTVHYNHFSSYTMPICSIDESSIGHQAKTLNISKSCLVLDMAKVPTRNKKPSATKSSN